MSDMQPGLIMGRWPGVVSSYNAASRECMVLVPGISEGGDVELLAEIEYPVGDKSKAGEFSTDILMMQGDLVWLSFIGGDPRYPVITGQRNPQQGNGTDWRRFHQANIELLATQVIHLIASGVIKLHSDARVLIEAPKVLIDSPDAETTGNLKVGGGLSVAGKGGAASSIAGDVAITGSSFTHNDKEVGSTHTHPGDSGGTTGTPN